jgi:hypothetical protein
VLLATLLVTSGLLPGVATGWYVHRRHGLLLAVLAGAGVTLALPFLLLSTLILFPPAGFVLGVIAGATALRAYDEGRIWTGTALVGAAAVAFSCASWGASDLGWAALG